VITRSHSSRLRDDRARSRLAHAITVNEPFTLQQRQAMVECREREPDLPAPEYRQEYPPSVDEDATEMRLYRYCGVSLAKARRVAVRSHALPTGAPHAFL